MSRVFLHGFSVSNFRGVNQFHKMGLEVFRERLALQEGALSPQLSMYFVLLTKRNKNHGRYDE